MTPEENSPKPGKRLAVFFDGTWNKPENNTNVWRLSLMLADRGEDGVAPKEVLRRRRWHTFARPLHRWRVWL